jgi:regulator of RNase E activity RraA
MNGPVQIGEVRVAAGDLVVADDTGVCFIPRDVAPVTGKWRIETVEINGPG